MSAFSTSRRSAAALLGVAAVLCTSSASAASAPPTLAVPAEVTAGRTLSMTATTTTTGQTCVLLATSPVGQLRRTAIAGLRQVNTGARGTVLASARPGLWTLQLRCGSRASRPLQLRVLAGKTTGVGARLVDHLQPYAFSTTRPAGLRTPSADQDGSGAPPFSPVALDGLGASTSERASRALQWALRQVGRKDYSLWCLRFVANAYNAARAGYPTAQAAADALDLRGRGGSPASAPAGALLFFHVTGKGGERYGHVGLSLGDGRMVSAQDTVKIERIRDVPMWRANYLGWALPPAAWPGFPPPTPVHDQSPQSERPPTGDAPIITASEVADSPESTTPAAKRRVVITTDNRVTNGPVMIEDPTPLRLQTRPESFCYSRGCVVPLSQDPGRFSGGTWDAAVCQIIGHEMTNGSYGDPSDDANPGLYTSSLWYGIELKNGLFGFVPETWIKAEFRGGLGLPTCDPVPPASDVPLPAAPTGLVIGYATTPLTLVADNRYAAGADEMIEDTEPVRLRSRPWLGCTRLGCVVSTVVDAGRFSGGTWTGVVCWTYGDRFDNLDPAGTTAPTHPGIVVSRRWYGIRLGIGKIAYVNEAYVDARYRGDRGLPYCPPYPEQLVDGW